MSSPKRPTRSDDSGTLLILLVLMFLAVGFLALTAMILPGAFGFLTVLLGLFLFGALHYVLWGWWLGKPRKDGQQQSGNDPQPGGRAIDDEEASGRVSESRVP